MLYAYRPLERNGGVALLLDALTREGRKLAEHGWAAISEGEVTAIATATAAAAHAVADVRAVGGTDLLTPAAAALRAHLDRLRR